MNIFAVAVVGSLLASVSVAAEVRPESAEASDSLIAHAGEPSASFGQAALSTKPGSEVTPPDSRTDESAKRGFAADPGSPSGGIQTRIVGGTDRSISYAPWQVAIIDAGSGANDYDGQFCGGSIISRDWIVSAAHCFDSTDPSPIRVLAGTATLSKSVLSTVTVSEIILHPSYNPRSNENGIALLKLSTPLTLTPESVEAISLPSVNPGAGSSARITGWGSTWCSNGWTSFNDDDISGCGPPANKFPTQLQGATILLQDANTCASEVGRSFSSRAMLCGGTTGYSQDTCQGDSGGPLAVQVLGRWTLAGITSWGYGCAWDSPGVYTNVANYTPWITANAPLPGEEPILATVTQTATGFTFTIANFDPATRYVATLTSGTGRARIGKGAASDSITVTGVNPGASATARVMALKSGHSTTSADVTGAANPLPVSDLQLVSDSGTSFTLNVANFDSRYRYHATVVSGLGRAQLGRASGTDLPITVTRVSPGAEVAIRVTVSLGKGSSDFVEFVR